MNDTSNDELRQHPRRPGRFPLYVALQGELYHKMVTVEARDISAGGLAFETRTSLPKDAKTTVMLGKLEGLPGTAHIEARVVHSEPLPGSDSFAVGVRFVRFVDITAEELMQAKSKIASRVVRGSERPMGRMQAIASAWSYTGEYRDVDTELKNFDAVSLENVREYLDRYPLDASTVIAIPHWLTASHDLTGADLTVAHAGELTLDRLATLWP